jgi:hypothetical protein
VLQLEAEAAAAVENPKSDFEFSSETPEPVATGDVSEATEGSLVEVTGTVSSPRCRERCRRQAA